MPGRPPTTEGDGNWCKLRENALRRTKGNKETKLHNVNKDSEEWTKVPKQCSVLKNLNCYYSDDDYYDEYDDMDMDLEQYKKEEEYAMGFSDFPDNDDDDVALLLPTKFAGVKKPEQKVLAREQPTAYHEANKNACADSFLPREFEAGCNIAGGGMTAGPSSGQHQNYQQWGWGTGSWASKVANGMPRIKIKQWIPAATLANPSGGGGNPNGKLGGQKQQQKGSGGQKKDNAANGQKKNNAGNGQKKNNEENGQKKKNPAKMASNGMSRIKTGITIEKLVSAATLKNFLGEDYPAKLGGQKQKGISGQKKKNNAANGQKVNNAGKRMHN